jgi:ParB-like chromosome segregation protein Spo0J
MTWRDHLLIHPAADLFPPMSQEELRELGNDIARHGLRTPVTLWSNSDDDEPYEALLDGRNRLDAAEQAGLLSVDDHGELRLRHSSGDYVPISKSYSREDDPFAFVISMNIHRRHLKPEKRQEILIALIARQPERSNRQIAKMAGVSDKTIGAARAKGEDVRSIPHVSRKSILRAENSR